MKKLIIMTIFSLAAALLPTISSAGTTVPHFLNYQSLLYDDGGNLVADGQTGITFKVTDSVGTVLYEERQTLDVVHGAVSALVGNGLNGAGAPMGGIPESVLSPDSGKYLEVTVDGYPAEGSLEIVSVPYSIYAEKALGAADESITSSALAKKSVTMDHLADDLVTDLATEMGNAGLIATRTDLTNLQTTFRSVSGASTIGVNAGLVYSGSNNLQAVLQDLDRAIQHRQVGVEAIQTTLSNHTTVNVATAHPSGTWPISRLDTDVATQSELNAETATRGGVDQNHETRLVALESKPPLPSPSAWGIVTGIGPLHGYNVAGVSGGGFNYTISFSEPMASEEYAVIVTPRSNATVHISNKTVNDFTVSTMDMGLAAFDFIVIGP